MDKINEHSELSELKLEQKTTQMWAPELKLSEGDRLIFIQQNQKMHLFYKAVHNSNLQPFNTNVAKLNMKGKNKK